MRELEVIEKEIEGDILITKTAQYNNLRAANVTVAENVVARLYGTINKDLVIKRGARVYLHAAVLGKIKNDFGELQVFDRV